MTDVQHIVPIVRDVIIKRSMNHRWMSLLSVLHIEVKTIWLLFCRRDFSNSFPCMTLVYHNSSSSQFVPRFPINNKPASVQIMAWRRTGNDGQIYWRIYPSTLLGGLMPLRRMWSDNIRRQPVWWMHSSTKMLLLSPKITSRLIMSFGDLLINANFCCQPRSLDDTISRNINFIWTLFQYEAAILC